MISVKMEFTRTVSSSGQFGRALRESPASIAHPLALAIKARVAQRGQPAQPAGPYGHGWRIIPSDYPGARGGKVLPNTGARFFKSSAELHAGTVHGSFNVSRGMWGGLTVITGFRNAVVKFRGRSRGQATGQMLKGGRRSKAKIDNNLKAASILHTKDVNVLALTEDEMRSIALGFQGLIRNNLRGVGNAAITWLDIAGAHSALARAIASRR